MRILIVTQYFWPEDFRINDLALGMKARGHDVTVLTGLPNYPSGRFVGGYGYWGPRRQDYGGVRVLRVPLLPRWKSRGWQLAVNYLSFVLSASVLGPLMCRGQFDVLFVWESSPILVGIPAIVMKAVKRASMLFWVQDLWPESVTATNAVSSSALLRPLEILVRLIYRGCDVILVQGQGFVSSVTRHGGRADQVRYFPNWAEDLYKPVALEADAPERALMPPGFRVVYAGNIGVAQDFPTILAAADLLKGYRDIHWVIFGEGRARDWVASEVAERGLEGSVHLLGRVPMDAIPRYSALADAMLVTLKPDPIFTMTIPTKVQSYMACGRPIVAAFEGEVARIARDSRAVVVCEPGNPRALARAVLDLYEMPPAEREAMGLRGRRYYEEHFDRTMLLSRLEGWMEELVKARRG